VPYKDKFNDPKIPELQEHSYSTINISMPGSRNRKTRTQYMTKTPVWVITNHRGDIGIARN
jgi:hypothetical protein